VIKIFGGVKPEIQLRVLTRRVLFSKSTSSWRRHWRGVSPIVQVRPGRGETGGLPGEARNAGPGGAVGAAQEGRTKRCGKGRP
jgi:hypothetical protein